MKIKYSRIVGTLAALLLVLSFVLPVQLATSQPVTANPGLMEWTPVDTPDTEAGQTKNLYSPVFGGVETGSEITKLVIANNGQTMFALITQLPIQGAVNNPATISQLRYRKSTNGGRSWSGASYGFLDSQVTTTAAVLDTLVWNMAMAPDSPNIVVAAVSDVDAGTLLPVNQMQIWISTDGGDNWDNTQWPPTGYGGAQGPTVAIGYVSALDISMDFGGREVLVGVRDGDTANVNKLWTMKMPSYGGWNVQNAAGTPPSTLPWRGDVIDAKFSPTYNGDSTIVVVYSQNPTSPKPGTWLVTGVHDIARNLTAWQNAGAHVEIKNTGAAVGSSALNNEIITGMLQLPSDYSGQSASLRRVYFCDDAINSTAITRPAPGALYPAFAANIPNRGVYRIDDTVVYTLMDNSTTFAFEAANMANVRAASIAYWGTYASGKLLVGERLGDTCIAGVPVWFTDSPTVCPVPCWYPAKKPPTGAAGTLACWPGDQGFGNAMVYWSPTFAAQGVAYAVTGASSLDGPYAAFAAQSGGAPVLNWPAAYFNVVALDESAMSLTRNNGETWNQLSLIDTRIIKLTDVAPSADCTTVYLASVNDGIGCQGFDSVWRSSTNEKVVAPPLPALPIGQIWERVRTSPTAVSCNMVESNYAILRLAPDKLDGQVVGWAAGGTSLQAQIGGFVVGANTRAMAWSPDFGDFWADINPRITVQDFAFESSTILYVLDTNGWVQKLPYTGTAWASTVNSVSTPLGNGGHTIEAMAPDKVVVGNRAGAQTPYAAAVSTNGATSFVPMMRPLPNMARVGYHVIFDTDFAKNAVIYLANDSGPAGINQDANLAGQLGLVYRNTAPAGANVEWTDMMTNMCFIGYAGPHRGYYGIVQTNSKNVTGQGTLYAAHTIEPGLPAPYNLVNTAYSGVERTLAPLDGIPKPGLTWACLDASDVWFRPNHPIFTLEPKSLKFCGCLTQDTNTTLYAIDNDFYSDNHNVARGVLSRFGIAFGVKTVGLLWEYTDCVAKKGPKLTMDDGTIIGCDPATGRSQEVNFQWEQLCIATYYQMQIAKDKAFTLMVFDSGNPCGAAGVGIIPLDVTAPAFVYFSGGGGSMPASAVTLATRVVLAVNLTTPALECGHGYFWRVRVLDETTWDMVNSPWSDSRTFTIKAGFRVTTPYYGPQLLAPDNGCGCACSAPLAFSWSPFKETVEYQFQLSENADMSSPLVNQAVKTTAFQWTGTPKCNKTYFWRVQATKPAPSEWSAVFSFQTQPEPVKVTTPPPAAPETPMWVWVIIAIGAILVIVTLVLIFKTRRV